MRCLQRTASCDSESTPAAGPWSPSTAASGLWRLTSSSPIRAAAFPNSSPTRRTPPVCRNCSLACASAPKESDWRTSGLFGFLFLRRRFRAARPFRREPGLLRVLRVDLLLRPRLDGVVGDPPLRLQGAQPRVERDPARLRAQLDDEGRGGALD